MPIDPNIILQAGAVKPLDYGELAGRALNQIGQRQQIDYQRSQMAANERAAAAAERKAATLAQVGQLAASGDAAGARKAALGAGQFDIIEALDKMDTAQVERMKGMAASTAPIIAQLGKIPAGQARAAAFEQAAPLFAQGGYTPEQLTQLGAQINNDNFLNLAVANGMKIADYNSQQNADRDYGFKREEFGYRQANDAANRGLTMRGQDITVRGQNMTDARSRETNNVTLAGIGKATVKNEGDLRKEFNNRPEVKEFREVATAYRQIKKAAANPTAANDLSLIFSYMKMLDPGSVVREGEFATAQNAAGVPDQVRNAYNRAASGERLNPEQRQQFVSSAAAVLEPRGYRFNDIANEYRGYAADYGSNPDRVARPVPTGAPKAVSIPTIKDNADYAKLKSGTTFIAPDGSRRVKP